MEHVLSGMGSRLFDELRDKQSLAYSVGCYLDTGLEPGGIVFYIATKPREVERSLNAFWQEIERIRSEAVSGDELLRAVNNIIGRQARRRQSSLRVSQELAYKELYGLDPEGYFSEDRKFRKVTRQQVLRAACRYLDRDNYVVAIVSPLPAEPAAEGRSGKKER
jgi:zinc protease